MPSSVSQNVRHPRARVAARIRAIVGGTAGIAVFVVLMSACASDAGSAMTVGSAKVSRDQLESELKAFEEAQVQSVEAGELEALQKKIHPDGSKDKFTPDFVAFVLNDLLIDATIAAEVQAQKAAASAKLSATDRKNLVENFGGEAAYKKLPDRFRTRVEQRQRDFAALLARESEGKDDPKSFFEKNKEKYVTVCASHILVATEEEANTLEAELAKGGDFAAIAKSKSTDTGSGAAGGELGCTSPSTYVPEFAAATIAQPINKVGPPVKSQFGYHIIKVTKRTDAKFEDVKSKIESELNAAPERAVSDKLIARLKNAKITVDPKYGKVDPVGTQGFPSIVSKLAPDASAAATELPASSVASSN